MTSLWHMTAPQIPSDLFDAKRCNVTIVGAGLTGLVAAVLLARAGRTVTVLEARKVGAVTTGNTTGKLSLLQGTTLTSLREHAGDDALRAYGAANREGQQWLVNELEAQGEQIERRDAFTYAATSAQQDALRFESEASQVAGIALDERSTTGLPFQTFGALTLADQVQLQPMRVLAMLARQLRAYGGKLIEHCRVRDVEQGDDGLVVMAERGDLRTDFCVLATGTPILDRGMFFAKLRPTRSYVTAYRLAESPPQGMYVSVGEPFRSLRTALDPEAENGQGNREVRPDELLVVGGGSSPVGTASDTTDELRRLDSWAALHFPSSQRVCWWAAQDYRTHSRIPFAGKMPRGADRIYVATGYNKWGMTNGVAAALAVSSELLGTPLAWAEELNDHCIKLIEARDALGMNITTAGRLVSGWAAAELQSVENIGELHEGEGVVARDGLDPVATSKVDGKVCRVSGVCTHLGGVLKWNSAERSWDCPLHGSRFAADGSLLEGPAVQDLRSMTADKSGINDGATPE